MICYTRNFEDVLIQRVFSDVPAGFYVDVGACMPVIDSNTYGLYSTGWTGVAVEPLLPDALRQTWQETRPRDTLVQEALGSSTGEIDFHIFEASQLSTGSQVSLDHWQANGLTPTQINTVQQTTLNDIMRKQKNVDEWHLLCIDVEGMEFDVLKGLDWQKHRPWLVVLEAVWPGTPTPNYQEWEPYLLEQGYTFAYFDAVNRYYVAQEHSDLLEHFKMPPNVWDNFRMYSELVLEHNLTAAQKEIASLQSQNADLVSPLIAE